jgi:hypothetical protein
MSHESALCGTAQSSDSAEIRLCATWCIAQSFYYFFYQHTVFDHDSACAAWSRLCAMWHIAEIRLRTTVYIVSAHIYKYCISANLKPYAETFESEAQEWMSDEKNRYKKFHETIVYVWQLRGHIAGRIPNPDPEIGPWPTPSPFTVGGPYTWLGIATTWTPDTVFMVLTRRFRCPEIWALDIFPQRHQVEFRCTVSF